MDLPAGWEQLAIWQENTPMYLEFLRPRLVGRRFDEHSLPLDIRKDFAALEEKLVEVANGAGRARCARPR